MKLVLAFLLLAAAAAAALSPWLALAAGWAGLIALLLAAIDWYRTVIEQRAESGVASTLVADGDAASQSAFPAPPVEVVIGRIQRHGFVRVRKGRRR